jgi:hypothetical protein
MALAAAGLAAATVPAGSALASPGARNDATAKREQHGGQLRGGIGVGKVAAYRPSVSDHAMRDQPHGGAQQRAEARHDLGVLYGRLAGERLDRNPMVSLVDPVEAGNPVDVDDVCRPSEAEVQERNERLATSENLRVL